MNEPTIYKQDDGTLRVDWPGPRPQWVQVAPDVIDEWAETHNELLARAERAEADADRLAEALRKCRTLANTATVDEPVFALPNKIAYTATPVLAAHDEAVAQR